jgi:hypothetical protein
MRFEIREGMNHAPDHLVAERRKALEAEIANLRSRLRALEAELNDLRVAERVWSRLTGREIPDETRQLYIHANLKPDNIPPMPEMIVEAIEEGIKSGRRGLTPADITTFVRSKYWPQVTINNVGPIAWRMWKRHQLSKEGAVYGLKTPEGESATT